MLGRQLVVRIRVRHVDALKGGLVREQKTIVEGVTRVDVMTQNNVCQLEGQHCGQICFRRKHVDQTLAQDDRVAHCQRFERCGEQHTAVNRVADLDVVADDDVVGNLLQNLV